MAWDEENILYHLTQHGWEQGDAPAERLESWCRTIHRATRWSREYVTWACVWVHPNATAAERKLAREQFPEFMGLPHAGTQNQGTARLFA